MPAPLIRTEVPGVYRRGSRYCVIYRDANGRQRKRSRPTMDSAIALKQEKAAERDAAAAELLAIARRAHARARADLGDVYGYLRQASQALDRTRGVNTLRQADALHAIYRAEDVVADAIREMV